MGYSNVDKTLSIRYEGSSFTLRALMKHVIKEMTNHIDNLLTTIGFVRIDDRGDFGTAIDNISNVPTYNPTEFRFFSIYKKNEDGNYLICTLCFCGLRIDYLNNSFSYDLNSNGSDPPYIYLRYIFTYSRTNTEKIYEIIENPNSALPFTYIDNIYTTNQLSFMKTIQKGNLYTVDIPFRLITNDFGKYLVLNNDENSIPHLGIIDIKDNKYPIFFLPSNTQYFSPYGTDLNSWRYGTKTSSLSNIFIIDGDTPRRGLNNFLSGFNFNNLSSKIPLIPVFETGTDSTSTTLYNFDKPIDGIYSTSKDFATTLGARYTTTGVYQITENNVVVEKIYRKTYRSLGNYFLMEESSEEVEE